MYNILSKGSIRKPVLSLVDILFREEIALLYSREFLKSNQ